MLQQAIPTDENLRDAIWEALEHLNWNYGKGDVDYINYEKRIVIVKFTSGFDYFRFRFCNDTVYFRGHQKKIKMGVMQQ